MHGDLPTPSPRHESSVFHGAVHRIERYQELSSNLSSSEVSTGLLHPSRQIDFQLCMKKWKISVSFNFEWLTVFCLARTRQGTGHNRSTQLRLKLSDDQTYLLLTESKPIISIPSKLAPCFLG